MAQARACLIAARQNRRQANNYRAKAFMFMGASEEQADEMYSLCPALCCTYSLLCVCALNQQRQQQQPFVVCTIGMCPGNALARAHRGPLLYQLWFKYHVFDEHVRVRM